MRMKFALFAAVLAAPTLLAQAPAPIRIHAATVLDGTGKTLHNATIVVQGSKIASIETGSTANPTYDLTRLTVMPGMIDVHSHVAWHFDKAGRYAARPGTPAEEILYSAENAWVTLREILLGFGWSVVTAIPLGLLIALSPLAKRMLYPLLVFVQLVPKIAIAPLFVVWLGFGLTSKVMLTLLLTFFPLLLASIAGFQILDQRLLYLTRSMGATTWQTFRYLRFPAALPVIFGGLKTSATIAATAAIVAEFVGSNKGLGYVLLQGTANLDTTRVFAVLFLLTVIGLALNSIVEAVEYFMTPWQRNQGKS